MSQISTSGEAAGRAGKGDGRAAGVGLLHGLLRGLLPLVGGCWMREAGVRQVGGCDGKRKERRKNKEEELRFGD